MQKIKAITVSTCITCWFYLKMHHEKYIMKLHFPTFWKFKDRTFSHMYWWKIIAFNWLHSIFPFPRNNTKNGLTVWFYFRQNSIMNALLSFLLMWRLIYFKFHRHKKPYKNMFIYVYKMQIYGWKLSLYILINNCEMNVNSRKKNDIIQSMSHHTKLKFCVLWYHKESLGPSIVDYLRLTAWLVEP